MTTVTKVDSNITGLSVAIEASLATLPGTPIWWQLEPNSYKNWGGQVTVTARNPIVPTRQQKKGSITDNKVDGGYVTDLKPDNLDVLIPGFFFAAPHQKWTSTPFNASQIAVSSIASSVLTLASAPAGNVVVGSLVYLYGFTTANNGLDVVTATGGGGTTITLTTSVADASPAATAGVSVVGFQGTSGDITMNVTGSVVTLESTAINFTTLGLIPGEWMYIGGDGATDSFATAGNNGFVRISSIAAHAIVLDKTSGTCATDAGTGKTIQLFFGSITKNETAVNNIVRYTYCFERTLGNDGTGNMAEYLYGAVPNELSLTLKAATLATADVTLLAVQNTSIPGGGTVLTQVGGAIVNAPSATGAFNTVSDFARVRLYVTDNAGTNPTQLAAYIMDATIDIKNNLTPDNALGVLGPFDLTAGNFEITGTLTAYFASQLAVEAIYANSDVTLDFALTKQNQGILVDIPLLVLGEGRKNVVKDKPIELPLSVMGAQSTYGWTASWTRFYYLPSVIAPTS